MNIHKISHLAACGFEMICDLQCINKLFDHRVAHL